MKVHLDFETRSTADLRSIGAAAYAAHPTTEVLCAAYQIDDSPVTLWVKGQEPPTPLLDAVRAGAIVCAHNALFELCIWTLHCTPVLGWPPLSPDKMDCTCVRARCMGLPDSLAGACQALNLEEQKDDEGHDLMLKMCTPRKARKGEDPEGVYWEESSEQLARLGEYCMQDIRAERALDDILPSLSDFTAKAFIADLTINMRGFPLDVSTMRSAIRVLDEAKKRIDARMQEITGGEVAGISKVTALKDWLTRRGVDVPDLQKATIDALVADISEDKLATEALRLRREGAKITSLAKYRAGMGAAYDGRARGMFMFHKAGTGRWAGSGYQPHNLERVDPESEDPKITAQTLHILSHARTAREAVDWLELSGLPPLVALGKCTRAMVCAPDGHEFIGADYSNVEGRGAAWLAGEEWKTQAFRDYDAGVGPDLYKLAYSRSFGVPVDQVVSAQRQIGKVEELALGYQGAVGAFISMGANYGIDAERVYKTVIAVADLNEWNEIARRYKRTDTYGLSLNHWTAFRYVVEGWRRSNPRIVRTWWMLQDVVLQAVGAPGVMLEVLEGKVRVYCTHNQRFLYIYLPSGRAISYFNPRITEDGGRQGVCYLGRSGDGNRRDVALYGGMIWENIIQGMCCDLLINGILNCEAAGYPVVLHVHDEVVVEIPEGQGDVKEVQALLTSVPQWAAGFPLVSKAWRDKRYVK